MDKYSYNAKDKDLGRFAENFVSRLGDSSGHHEQDYFDMVRLLLSVKRHGSFLDIGAGIGRITSIAKDIVVETVALEPDEERWLQCYKACHEEPRCQVLRQLSSGYLKDNPGKKFDVIVIGMVIQHISTKDCQALLEDAASLLKPDGVAIIYTTHTADEASGFSYSAATLDEVYISEQEFNRYAEDSANQTKGIPVRRFSKAELLTCLDPYFDVINWRQTSYYREDRLGFFTHRLQVSPEILKDVGNSQFVVVQKKR